MVTHRNICIDPGPLDWMLVPVHDHGARHHGNILQDFLPDLSHCGNMGEVALKVKMLLSYAIMLNCIWFYIYLCCYTPSTWLNWGLRSLGQSGSWRALPACGAYCFHWRPVHIWKKYDCHAGVNFNKIIGTSLPRGATSVAIRREKNIPAIWLSKATG